MVRVGFACLAFFTLSACAVVNAPTPPAPAAVVVTAPEVNVVSDYPPVKAAVLPLLQALGYQIAQDQQYWTILAKPSTSAGELPVRLNVSFASIRTHTRVIADIGYIKQAGTREEHYEPFPAHPDRAAIQAALDRAKHEVEKRPLVDRQAPAPPPQPIAAVPGAPVWNAPRPAFAPPPAAPPQ